MAFAEDEDWRPSEGREVMKAMWMICFSGALGLDSLVRRTLQCATMKEYTGSCSVTAAELGLLQGFWGRCNAAAAELGLLQGFRGAAVLQVLR